MVRVGVISDTHIPGRGRRLPGMVFELFREVDLILHAGDFVGSTVIDQLKAVAPTIGVLGNCDVPELTHVLPVTTSIDCGGIKIGMVHDTGSADRRRARLAKAFPEHRVVVFGHSHRPLVEDDGSLMLLNPGSACDPRSARIPTVAILEVEDGKPKARLVNL